MAKQKTSSEVVADAQADARAEQVTRLKAELAQVMSEEKGHMEARAAAERSARAAKKKADAIKAELLKVMLS